MSVLAAADMQSFLQQISVLLGLLESQHMEQLLMIWLLGRFNLVDPANWLQVWLLNGSWGETQMEITGTVLW